MIKITIELISARDPKYNRLLGQAVIGNDGIKSTDTKGQKGDYTFELSKWAPKEKEVWKRGVVRNFDRIRRGPWDLLFLCLKEAVGKRNG